MYQNLNRNLNKLYPELHHLAVKLTRLPSPESVSESSSTTPKTQHPAPTSNQSGNKSGPNVSKQDSKLLKQTPKNQNRNRNSSTKPKKGDNDTVAIYNKYDILDHDMEISDDTIQSPNKSPNRAHGSSRKSRSRSPRGASGGGPRGRLKSPVKAP